MIASTVQRVRHILEADPSYHPFLTFFDRHVRSAHPVKSFATPRNRVETVWRNVVASPSIGGHLSPTRG